MTTVAHTTRISRRDLHDCAVRILRVAGSTHGEAKRAALVVEHLEIHRGIGVDTLSAAVDDLASVLAITGSVEPEALGPGSWNVSAAGRSAVLLVPPLADLLRSRADEPPVGVRIDGLRDVEGLEALVLGVARTGHTAIAAWATTDSQELAVGLAGAAGAGLLRGPCVGIETLAARLGCDAAADGWPQGERSSDRALIAIVAMLTDVLDPDDVEPLRAVGADMLEKREDEVARSGLAVSADAWQRVASAARRWLVDDR